MGAGLRELWQQRRLSRRRIDVSGVWRFREMLPFVTDEQHIVTLPEGNTPLFEAPAAAAYAGLDGLQFKHQGYNPTASFKDNGMTAGVTQARVLGMRRVACVSTGNTSASMAAYAAAADMQAVIFLPAGKIAYGKLAQALEYGALTIQVEANFDRILALVRELAVALGIYVLNSVNPFRIEGQKSIVVEMLEQRGWRVPDWIVLPGGNLGNISALGKGLRELRQLGLIDSLPRVAVIQAEGAAPFHAQFRDGGELRAVRKPETLATAIRIGDPVSWRKAAFEVGTVHGVVESVTEQEIADAKAVIGRCGIGCEPASAATLAGIPQTGQGRRRRGFGRGRGHPDGAPAQGSGLRLPIPFQPSWRRRPDSRSVRHSETHRSRSGTTGTESPNSWNGRPCRTHVRARPVRPGVRAPGGRLPASRGAVGKRYGGRSC